MNQEIRLGRIESKVERIDRGFNEVEVRVEAYHKRLGIAETAITEMGDSFKKLNTAMIGDYQSPGIVTELRETMSYVENQKKKCDEDTKAKKDWKKYIVESLIAAGIGYIVWKLQTGG